MVKAPKAHLARNGVIIACIFPCLPLFVVIVVAFVAVVALGSVWPAVYRSLMTGQQEQLQQRLQLLMKGSLSSWVGFVVELAYLSLSVLEEGQ